jgi:hypothetical protein
MIFRRLYLGIIEFNEDKVSLRTTKKIAGKFKILN